MLATRANQVRASRAVYYTRVLQALKSIFKPRRGRTIAEPRIIPRADHNISRADISDSALKVLYRLKDSGYRACLVGGGVRDLLLGVQPKDFDVATDASPEQIRKVFNNARLIGRRFRLAHVRFGREIIEVSTFRADLSDAEQGNEHRHLDDSGRILRDNVYGSIDEDARRRDFTVNGLYYDISDFSIHDYVGGMADIETRTLRLMGDPDTRYREDPVRMLRALRIAAKLDLTIEPDTLNPIRELAGLMADVPPARLFDEVLKALMAPYGLRVYQAMREQGLFRPLFPASAAAMDGTDDAGETIIRRAIENTGQRMLDDKPVTPAFLYAAFLWPAVREAQLEYIDEDKPPAPALAMAQRDIISAQVQRVSIPKRFSVPMREIWQLQPRFHKRRGKQPQRLMSHPRFRAAYDFLLLRAEAGEVDDELAQWWTRIQEDPDSPAPEPAKPGSARRRRGGRGRGRRRSTPQ